MDPSFMLTEFELSLKRAEVELTEQQVVEICTGWGFLEPLFNRFGGFFHREADPKSGHRTRRPALAS